MQTNYVHRTQRTASRHAFTPFETTTTNPRMLHFALLLLVLSACSEQDLATGPENKAAILGVSLINNEAGQTLPGFESISDGSTIELSELGAAAAHLKANVVSDSVSKVQLTVNGESYMDDTAPYTFPGPDSAGWQLEHGDHTFSATPYLADGRLGTPLQISFSVTLAD